MSLHNDMHDNTRPQAFSRRWWRWTKLTRVPRMHQREAPPPKSDSSRAGNPHVGFLLPNGKGRFGSVRKGS